jgi:DNA mismatch repair ATPase MutS
LKNIYKIVDEAEENIKKAKIKDNIFSAFKLILFVLIAYQIYIVSDSYTFFWLVLLFLSFLSFICLFILSSKNNENLIFKKNVIKICNEIIAEKSEENIKHEFVNNHSYANDLDLFGANSLFEKINRTKTKFGREKLSFFLLNHLASCNEIKERQEAIKELSYKIEWNVKFLAIAKSIQSRDFENINFYFNNSDFKIINTAFFRKSLVLIPVLNLLLFTFFFVSNFSVVSFLGLIIPIFNFFIMKKLYGNISKNIYDNINLNSESLSKFTLLFLLIEQEKFNSKLNDSNKSTLFNKTKSVSFFINKLSYLIHQYENRMSPFIGDLLDIFLLWNLQFAFRIGKIMSENQKELPKWFETIGNFEALISFGLYAYKNQDFKYPECSNSLIFQAENISHPLIRKESRITNNISCKTENNVIIITGANMTGKSTFLRTLGINLVLAMNGCPICADSLIFKPMKLFTSMRTNDSLADGDSYFLTEIKKLKSLIDELEKNEPHFILLDEILKGTNSEDKLEGSKLFIEKIINNYSKFICFIATHDLELTKLEEKYNNEIENFCFELYQHNEELLPDYKLKKGITKTMNAIRLMKQYKIID